MLTGILLFFYSWQNLFLEKNKFDKIICFDKIDILKNLKE